MRQRIRLLPLFLAMAVAAPAGSFVHSGSRWPGATTTFYVDIVNASFGAFSPSGPSWDSAFIQAAGYWNAGGGFSFATSSTFSDPCSLADTRNGVDFTLTECGVSFGSTTLAVTFSLVAGPLTTETNIIFNEADYLWDVYSGPFNGVFEDFRRVAAHELGHALQLDHSSPSTLMGALVSDIETPQLDDLDGVVALYSGCDQPAVSIGASSTSLGTLAVTDCMLSEEGGPDHSLFDLFSVVVGTPGTFDLQLDSTEFDAFLLLFDTAGNVMVQDDDSGTGLNARIIQAVPAGSYMIAANTFEGEAGGYSLSSMFTPSVPHTLSFVVPASGAPDPVASQRVVVLASQASDSHGHAITHAWWASCPGLAGDGSFSDASVANPLWTAPANPTATSQTCTIQVSATGSSGLSANSQYSQGVSFVDSDSDGHADVSDNCPFFSNPGQADDGGLGAASPPDGVGNACQCGDVNGDGFVTTADALIMRRAQLVPPTAAMGRPDLCDVGGTASCSSADPLILRRALLAPPTAAITQQCAPALP